MTRTWQPPSEIETQRAGVYWDAVRIEWPLAEKVLRTLGRRTGAVIEDRWAHVWYWLVPPGTADTWDVPGSLALGVACWVTVPCSTKSDRIVWRVPPNTHPVLTGPRLLAEALAGARSREATA
jgi:hypothetical protein